MSNERLKAFCHGLEMQHINELCNQDEEFLWEVGRGMSSIAKETKDSLEGCIGMLKEKQAIIDELVEAIKAKECDCFGGFNKGCAFVDCKTYKLLEKAKDF